jgi:hypothetical protein
VDAHGRTSASTTRKQPINAFLTRKPLVNNRKLLVANNFLTSVPPNVFLASMPCTNVRKPLVPNAFLKNAPPRHDGRRPQQPSSFGFATVASKSTSPKRLYISSNVRPLLPACDTSRNVARAVMAEERQRQAAATQEKVLANEVNEQRCHKATKRAALLAEMVLAKERCGHKEAEHAALSAARSLADEQRCHEAAACAAASADLALAKERCRHEMAWIAAMLAEKSLANKQRCHKVTKQAAALAEQALAEEQRCHEKADLAAILAETALADEQHCHGAAACNAALAELALAKEQCCHEVAELTAMLAERTLTNELVAESRPNALRRQRSRRWPWSKPQYRRIWRYPSRHWPRINNARRKPPKNNVGQTTSALWHWYCRPTPSTRQPVAFGQNALYSLLLSMPSWPRLHATTLRKMPKLCRQQPHHIQWPCHHPPTALLHIRTRSFLPWGGALTQRPLLWHRWLYHHLPTMANSGWYANAPDLIIVLVTATILKRPALLTRFYFPTLTQRWGGFLHQLRPLLSWREQPHLVAQWCRHLQPCQQHPLLPPSYPLPFVARYLFLWGKGLPIHSVLVARLCHHGSTHNASTVLVVLANVMAPGLPIHKSTFFVGGVIGLMLPINKQSALNGWA